MSSLIRFGLSALVVALTATSSQAAPSPVDVRRRDPLSSVCDSNIITTSNFILYNNPWGAGSATSGFQCTYLDAQAPNEIAWQAQWTWEGGQYNVKSYPNAVLNQPPKQLDAIPTIPSQWTWS